MRRLHMRGIRLSLLLSVGLFAALAASACQAQTPIPSDSGLPDIDRTEVERIINVLAADDMEGRASFTPAAQRTADFIAEEFGRAGLASWNGLEGYQQSFPVYSVTVTGAEVTVDGVRLAEEDVMVRSSSGAFSWTTGDAEVVSVGPEDDAQQAIFAAVRGGGDKLILVDPSHRTTVRRLARYLSGPVRTMDLQAGGRAVIATLSAGAEVAYAVDAAAEVTESPLVNVVGMIPGRRTDEIVVFSAHHDHMGIGRPADGDSIYNGANDDASGTTAVIALADYYAHRGTPERTLLFVAFAAEEMGGYGARYFSQQLDPERIVAMFNIEMIGKPAVEGPNTAWITGFERSSFGTLLQEAVEGTGYEFYADPYPDQNLFYRSDNATLARLGVPAHSISTTPIDVDPDYHRPSDEVGTLDLDHLTNTIRAIAMGAETIVSGEATPTRVDPTAMN